ncbi:MAG: hypothetical protein M3514_00330, partial [Actinomycetota bacterium]|nr:hypothetical protein [Actinomycetota bacterium]
HFSWSAFQLVSISAGQHFSWSAFQLVSISAGQHFSWSAFQHFSFIGERLAAVDKAPFHTEPGCAWEPRWLRHLLKC